MSSRIDVAPEDVPGAKPAGEIPEEQRQRNERAARKKVEELQNRMRHGVLVAVPTEYSAVDAVFGKTRKWPNPDLPDSPVHYVQFDTDTGPRAVLIAGITEAGIAQAASRASLIKWTNRRVTKIIMVGIAAGQPALDDAERDVRLGDIVVGDRVVQHDHVKITDGTIERRGRNLQLPDADLLQAVGRMRARFRLTGERREDLPWTRHIRAGTETLLNAARPVKDQNGDRRSYGPDDGRSGRRPDEPYVHVGTIASGSTLLKDEALRDELAKEFDSLAYEMEGAGLAIASSISDFKYVVVRGICDYADKEKDDTWQPYAALVATSFARALLEEI